MARLSLWRFALLISGATREQALKLVEATLGHPPMIEMDEGALNLSFLVDVYAQESKRQDVPFAHFYKAGLAALEAQSTPVRTGIPESLVEDFPSGFR